MVVIAKPSKKRAATSIGRSRKPDLLIADIGLPDRDGVELIQRVRAWSAVPIIVLSARTGETQKIAALDVGADDYVTKSFGAAELLARVRAALRRNATGALPSSEIRLGNLVVDLARRDVRGAGAPVHLTPLEFRVLEVFLARRFGAATGADSPGRYRRRTGGSGEYLTTISSGNESKS